VKILNLFWPIREIGKTELRNKFSAAPSGKSIYSKTMHISAGDGMDFRKSFEASMMPVSYLLGLVIANSFLSLLPGLLGIATGLVVFLMILLVYVWAGYHSVKKFKLNVGGAALTGAMAGFIFSPINEVLWLMTEATRSLERLAVVQNILYNLTLGIGSTLMQLIFWTVAGAVLAAIGGFIAQKKKKR
jgi:UPF0716 family protein affecting phage T7 exclusion